MLMNGADDMCELMWNFSSQIKVRLQTQPMPKPGEAPQFKGVWDCAAKTIRSEGVRVSLRLDRKIDAEVT